MQNFRKIQWIVIENFPDGRTHSREGMLVDQHVRQFHNPGEEGVQDVRD